MRLRSLSPLGPANVWNPASSGPGLQGRERANMEDGPILEQVTSLAVPFAGLRAGFSALQRASEAPLQQFNEGIRTKRSPYTGMRVQQFPEIRSVGLPDKGVPMGDQLQQRPYAYKGIILARKVSPRA